MAAGVAAILALTAYLTLYLPTARPNANEARAGNIRLWLHAKPAQGAAAPPGWRAVDLDLSLSGPIQDVSAVDFAADMPTMSHDPGSVQDVIRVAPNHYTAQAALDMGGLWRVQVVLHHLDGSRQTAAFDVRI